MIVQPTKRISEEDHKVLAIWAAVSERDWQYQRLPKHLRSMAFPTSKH